MDRTTKTIIALGIFGLMVMAFAMPSYWAWLLRRFCAALRRTGA